MKPTWLLVANRSRARLFEVPRDGDDPVEIADFAHPAGRAHERDLITEGTGRFYGKGEQQQGHSAVQNVEVSRAEAERFAEELRDYLEQARTHERFDKLWIMAGPQFLGVLRDKLTKGVEKEVEFDVDKDVTTEAPRDILASARRERERRASRA
jgi:protein required for attachment to host cells